MNTAQQSILRTIRRRLARSVVIKDAKAYEALYGQLQTAMTNAWDDAMREGIAAALDRLRDLGPGTFTKEDGAAILRVLEGSVGEDAIRAAMREPVINLTDALFRTGAEEVGQAAGVAISFMRPDLDALDVLKTGNLYWIGNSWNIKTQNKMAAILEDYFTEGMTREGLTQRFAEDFASLTERSRVYWEILADHTATKTREIGRVTGYERAGITHVQVRAHLDDRTTRICRHMHGRIIEVSKMRAQADAYLEAAGKRNEPAAKAAWTMHGADADLSGIPTSKLDKGTASPPYHFRCRTITVAYFGSGDSDLDRWTVAAYDREPLSRKDVGTLIERARSARWPHSKVMESHFRRKAGELGFPFLDEYNQSAVDLIRRGDRDVYISLRKGVLNATFVRPFIEQRKGKPGYIVTSVDLAENKITSHHWREKLETTGDEVPALKQPGRGIMKWLFG
ncbi:MAG: hypothetical protein CR993_03125 [Rhodobacterales bacterium]|nr:MAG: hypothetical protein CR993_03125 [Rhodobacterales bacterium]